jgi:hypothetical protein
MTARSVPRGEVDPGWPAHSALRYEADVELSIRSLSRSLGRTWLIVGLGLAYLVSQLAILATLGRIGPELLRLQCLGFSAAETLRVFRGWEASGALNAYRAHFLLDDVHWLWYAGFFTAVLGRLFERRGVTQRLDWILALPLASGLLDFFENRIQHVFLSAPDFSTIVDPLPLISTAVSGLKWLLVLFYVGTTLVLLVRPRRAPEGPPGAC